MKKTSAVKVIIALLAVAALASAASITPAKAGESVTLLNSAPVAENMELETYRSIPVTGSFRCLDPEGDGVTYSVSRRPKKGVVEVNGDAFTYTPLDGKKGRDSFTYVATDSAGNVSNAATVTINIKKQKTSVSYADLEGSDAWYAATVLAENNIFIGESVGGRNLFRPDEPVSRGEFLVMCMKLTGAPILEGITRTGFSDDEDIPDWQKPYVTTAVMGDIITGSISENGDIVFSPDEPITFAQAAVMLNNSVGITDVSFDDDAEYPAWASQAAANLSSLDILPTEAGSSPLSVTRADAAKMLLAAKKVIDSRETFSLLPW